MEENKTLETTAAEQEQSMQQSIFSYQNIFKIVILNWKWFLLSFVVCMGLAFVYLRYATPKYQAFAKLLVKDEDKNRYGNSNSIMNMKNLGLISGSNGIDNEIEILSSHSVAEAAVRDLKLYVNYKHVGRVKNAILYKYQPITVDMDAAHLEKLEYPVSMRITKDEGSYEIEYKYGYYDQSKEFFGPFENTKTVKTLPTMIRTRVGNIFISLNKIGTKMEDGESELVTIVSPEMAAVSYVGKLSVSQTSKLTTIAALTLTDEVPERAIAYLKQLAICYNRQANEDKNEIAVRTEQFINGRLEKINAELGSTEGALEKYKRANKVVELKVNAGAALNRSNEYERQLADANMQVALLNSIADYMNEPANKYQTLPSNVGLNDATATTLINRYNDIVLNRNRLLRTASENSPTVTPLTAQLDDLASSIRRAMAQARRNMAIQRQSAESQYGKYQNEIVETPGQERILTQIGRQQEVKSALYTMLLQKREENSISLAATADKGKLIDEPAFGGRVSPKKTIICLAALVLGGAIPFFFFVLLDFFRYKIEGHEDVAKLTKLPILADVPVAAESAKTKADIVVHENQNNHMEEVFRSMRTNIQFMLKEGQKVILTTSTTSGEGKTFIAANLAVSFALLGKKVVLVGLDIRKPRLAELFEINNHHTGITNLLTKAKPTVEDVKSQMLDSGVNPNLDLLLAGPIPPNPAELLARDSLDQVFDMLREMYDYIIIDTAPLGLVTDTLQLKRLTDCSVYICRADYTPKESFTMINGLAEEDKLPNLSIVINGVDLSKKKYGYYYGYGTYGKYGKYGKYGSYGGYGHYGKYGKYGSYGSYGNYGHYGRYGENKYNNANDSSIKR